MLTGDEKKEGGRGKIVSSVLRLEVVKSEGHIEMAVIFFHTSESRVIQSTLTLAHGFPNLVAPLGLQVMIQFGLRQRNLLPDYNQKPVPQGIYLLIYFLSL